MQVDDKYQYSCDNKDIRVHGWISSIPHVGFWQITPSDEFRSGGPLKQSLTSHVGPTTLAVMADNHYKHFAKMGGLLMLNVNINFYVGFHYNL